MIRFDFTRPKILAAYLTSHIKTQQIFSSFLNFDYDFFWGKKPHTHTHNLMYFFIYVPVRCAFISSTFLFTRRYCGPSGPESWISHLGVPISSPHLSPTGTVGSFCFIYPLFRLKMTTMPQPPTNKLKKETFYPPLSAYTRFFRLSARNPADLYKKKKYDNSKPLNRLNETAKMSTMIKFKRQANRYIILSS